MGISEEPWSTEWVEVKRSGRTTVLTERFEAYLVVFRREPEFRREPGGRSLVADPDFGRCGRAIEWGCLNGDA